MEMRTAAGVDAVLFAQFFSKYPAGQKRPRYDRMKAPPRPCSFVVPFGTPAAAHRFAAPGNDASPALPQIAGDPVFKFYPIVK